MYIYFDRQGNLKEVLYEPLRAGDYNAQAIAIKWDNHPENIRVFSAKIKDGNGEIHDIDSINTNEVSLKIEYNQDRDLHFLKQGVVDNYFVYQPQITLPKGNTSISFVFSYGGVINEGILTGATTKFMQLATFNVEESNELIGGNNINRSQWETLIELLRNNSVVSVDSLGDEGINYKFLNSIDVATDNTWVVDFECDGVEYDRLIIEDDTLNFYNQLDQYTEVYANGVWLDAKYKRITFDNANTIQWVKNNAIDLDTQVPELKNWGAGALIYNRANHKIYEVYVAQNELALRLWGDPENELNYSKLATDKIRFSDYSGNVYPETLIDYVIGGQKQIIGGTGITITGGNTISINDSVVATQNELNNEISDRLDGDIASQGYTDHKVEYAISAGDGITDTYSNGTHTLGVNIDNSLKFTSGKVGVKEFVKDATLNAAQTKLTLTKGDGTTIEFEGGGGGATYTGADGILIDDDTNTITLDTDFTDELYDELGAASAVQDNLDLEEAARESADTELANSLSAKEDATNKSQSIDTSTTKYPSNNAVKDFVNSSIATTTANFKGTLDVVDDLELQYGATTTAIASALNDYTFSPAPTINDYCFVINKDTSQNTIYERFKYTGSAWLYEYQLNNSSFTATQWAAINSGVNTTNIGQIATNTTAIAGKQNAITSSNKLSASLVDGLSAVATSGKTSDLDNDSGFITDSALSDYATKSELEDKQDTLTAGANITITNNVISAESGGGLFEVTYGTTTYAAISSAISSGLQPICKYNGITYYLNTTGTDYYTFTNMADNDTLKSIKVTSANVWQDNSPQGHTLKTGAVGVKVVDDNNKTRVEIKPAGAITFNNNGKTIYGYGSQDSQIFEFDDGGTAKLKNGLILSASYPKYQNAQNSILLADNGTSPTAVICSASQSIVSSGEFISSYGNTQIYGDHTIAFGRGNYNTGSHNLIMGNSNYNTHSNVSMLGHDLRNTNRDLIHIVGQYNLDDGGSYLEVVGNGTSGTNRKNIRTLDWYGNEIITGNFKAAGLTDGTTTKTMTEILAGGGTTYTAGNGISISSANAISIDNDVVPTQTQLATEESARISADDALSDRIDNLSGRGKYLSTWDCELGEAETTPPVNPYPYTTGDYFIVSNVGTTNFKPAGTSYDEQDPDSDSESEDVSVNDTYIYDGNGVWRLIHAADKEITISSVVGLQSALDDKATTSALSTHTSNTDIHVTSAWKSQVVSDIADLNTSVDALTSGKQATLNATQLLAVNSGIDSGLVQDIRDNKNVITIKEWEAPSGETWVINSSPALDRRTTYTISFTSNNESYSSLRIDSRDSWILYDTSTIYDSGTWTNQAYRTITFETPPTGDLLTWLQANAVKQ